MKLFCTYKHTEKPWGGANSFIRSIYKFMEKEGNAEVSFDSIDDSTTHIFINQLSKGPERGTLSKKEIKQILQVASEKGIPIITRVVNLKAHAFNIGIRYLLFGIKDDILTYFLIRKSDLTIFQSHYQKEFFLKYAPFFWRKKVEENSIIIHNGAGEFYNQNSFDKELSDSDELVLVSNTFSPRKTKRHDIIRDIASLDGVKVRHIGNWPKGQSAGNVILEGVKTKEQIKEIYAESHYLLHPAIKDPCPNVLFEAIISGLPVIYNSDTGSSAEIVKNNGFAFNEMPIEHLVSYSKKHRKNYVDNVRNSRDFFSIKRAVKEYLSEIKKL